MATFDESLPEIQLALEERYGRIPSALDGIADSFTMAVAVILDRAIDSKKVRKGIEALAEAGLLDPQAMADADYAEVVDSLAAFSVSVPARVIGAIRNFAAWFVSIDQNRPSDPLTEEEGISTGSLREELVGLSGIGQATADAILLQAGHRSIYPVDRPTYRILIRHGWLDASADYEEARSVMERPGQDAPETLTRLSSWFEQLGRDYCKASVAKCARCPLQAFLPEGGPLDPEAY